MKTDFIMFQGIRFSLGMKRDDFKTSTAFGKSHKISRNVRTSSIIISYTEYSLLLHAIDIPHIFRVAENRDGNNTVIDYRQ